MSKILTGDRPTGSLHLGHFVGSLRNRVDLQHLHQQTILIADNQALTDNMGNPDKVRHNILEVAKDYIACGIDPNKTNVCIQSHLPAIAELSLLYLNLVTVARLERNPTIREEIKSKNFERSIPAGFLAYPVAQAADITAFKADLVPVGEDQLPLIEQANEIVHKLNALVGFEIVPAIKALTSSVARLPSLDGKSKMSKSLGNTISLYASLSEIKKAVNLMYTDSNHLRIEDPGQVEGNVVFTYLDAFDPDIDEVSNLKELYKLGGLGDGVLKKRLVTVLETVIAPIREKRLTLNNQHDFVIDVLKTGTIKSLEETNNNVNAIKEAFGFFKF